MVPFRSSIGVQVFRINQLREISTTYQRRFIFSTSYSREAVMNPENRASSDPLFPHPVHIEGLNITPKPWAGVTHESSAELSRLLRVDYDKYHCFFNQEGFHNHLAHHLYAAYWFGTTPQLLRTIFNHHAVYQRPSFESPGPITVLNWKKHLGDERYYNAYLKFFGDVALTSPSGISPLLEKYVFSEEANQPDARMFDRFLSGLAHPMIHLGHGTEFKVLGTSIQGLAMTAVHKPQTRALLPSEFFGFTSGSVAAYETVQASLSNLRLSESPSVPPVTKGGAHTLAIVADILRDPDLSAGKTCERTSTKRFVDTLDKAGDLILSYTRRWTVDTPEEVLDKLEELSWLATLFYGLGGFRKGHDFRADFFLCHLVTSSLFLPSLLASLSFPSQSALLRGHFSVMIGYWISRGRPELPIADYYEATADLASQLPSKLQIPLTKDALDCSGAMNKENRVEEKGQSKPTIIAPANLWLSIAQSSLSHPDEHLLKIERSLAHYARMYGTRPVGFLKDAGLKDAHLLDGTLFQRVGFQSMNALGWVREGQPVKTWDRAGLGWDEVW